MTNCVSLLAPRPIVNKSCLTPIAVRLTIAVVTLTLLIATGVALGARADLVTVGELLAQADKWHGRPVVVSGSVNDLKEQVSQRGNPYYTFTLSDGGAAGVTVFSYGKPAVRFGQRVQVEGVFHKVKRVGKFTFPMQVDARRITTL